MPTNNSFQNATSLSLAATVAPVAVAVVSLQYAVIGGVPQMGASEGNAAGNIQFEIRRDGDTSGTSVVQYEIGAPADDWFPPASPQDLSAAYSVFPSALVTFAPGESVKTVTLPLQDDALLEPWEAFAVRLFNPTNAVVGRNAAFGGDISYPNDRWSGRMMFREVQERFEPAVGFSTRNYFDDCPSYCDPVRRHHFLAKLVDWGDEV